MTVRPFRQAIAACSLYFAIGVWLIGTAVPALAEAPRASDVVVYGATPAGITASIAAADSGQAVLLLAPKRHVGGMSTSGLGRNEAPHLSPKKTFGGLAQQFFNQIRPGGPGNRRWHAHKAERIFEKMLSEAGVDVRYQQRLDRVTMKGPCIQRLHTQRGRAYNANVFIDATYEGDLLAAAGVSYKLGRESRDQYGETLAGVRYRRRIDIDVRDAHGDLLPGVTATNNGLPEEGSGDHRVMCYNVRLNITDNPENRVPIEKPKGYDPRDYALLLRCIKAGVLEDAGDILGMYGLPGGKVELNNRQAGIVSLGMLGAQHGWAEASYPQRAKIHRRHRRYTQGMLWFLQHDPRVPENIQQRLKPYGLCKDEWPDNDHWPYYLYVREARRMVGPDVMTQADVTTDRAKESVIALGSHFIDSHDVARFAHPKGGFVNEGRLWQPGRIFDLPYWAMTPKKTQCQNLLVPVCVSASHVAFSAIRLEPTWMKLGEVAGLAAAIANKQALAVQQVPIDRLQQHARRRGIPLEPRRR
jgi:hypothetical protein